MWCGCCLNQVYSEAIVRVPIKAETAVSKSAGYLEAQVTGDNNLASAVALLDSNTKGLGIEAVHAVPVPVSVSSAGSIEAAHSGSPSLAPLKIQPQILKCSLFRKWRKCFFTHLRHHYHLLLPLQDSQYQRHQHQHHKSTSTRIGKGSQKAHLTRGRCGTHKVVF